MEKNDWGIRIVSSLVLEGIGAVFSVAALGIIWAIWKPDWIEGLLKKAFGTLFC